LVSPWYPKIRSVATSPIRSRQSVFNRQRQSILLQFGANPPIASLRISSR
jgi:hypothetical protein